MTLSEFRELEKFIEKHGNENLRILPSRTINGFEIRLSQKYDPCREEYEYLIIIIPGNEEYFQKLKKECRE